MYQATFPHIMGFVYKAKCGISIDGEDKETMTLKEVISFCDSRSVYAVSP